MFLRSVADCGSLDYSSTDAAEATQAGRFAKWQIRDVAGPVKATSKSRGSIKQLKSLTCKLRGSNGSTNFATCCF